MADSSLSLVGQCLSEVSKKVSVIERSLKRLPYDAELEYVTFPAGSCLDTEVFGIPKIFNWEMTLRLPSTAGTTGKFYSGIWNGSAVSTTLVWIDIDHSRKLDIIAGADYRIDSWDAIQGSFGKIGYDGSKVFCGESSVATSGTSTSTTNLHFTICGVNGVWNNTLTSFDVDVASAKFTYNGIVGGMAMRDFIPVRVNGAGYLYDKISERFFGSATEVALVPGPDKV